MSKLEFKEVEKVLAEDGAETLEEGSQNLNADATPFLQPFEITVDVEAFMEKYRVADQVDLAGDGEEKVGKLKEEVAQDLANTKQLFTSQEEASKRLEAAQAGLKMKVEEMCKTQSLACDVKVEYVESEMTNSCAFRITLSKGEEEADLEVMEYSFEPWIQVAEAAESYGWAAWLGIEESPFFDEDFATAYDYDQMSIALDQFVSTIDESQDKGDIENLIKEFKSGSESKWKYIVDIDERGVFKSHVENSEGQVEWEASSEDSEDGSFGPIEDGFMRYADDTEGLERHLKELGIMPKEAKLSKGN